MGVPMLKPHGPRRAGFLLLVRPSLEVETPSPGIFMGIIVRRCPINMKGVLKVIRRSRATLIFSMGVPMLKPHGPRRAGFLLLVRPSLEVETPSPGIFMGIIVRRCPINMKGF